MAKVGMDVDAKILNMTVAKKIGKAMVTIDKTNRPLKFIVVQIQFDRSFSDQQPICQFFKNLNTFGQARAKNTKA